MRYQVPQFIEVEDKIFGPLTLKQFIYLLGAGGIFLMFISIWPLLIAIPAALPFVVASIALAFFKVNERPLIDTVEHAFKYMLSNKLYLWKQRPADEPQESVSAPVVVAQIAAPGLSEGKLKDLAWSLNIKDKARLGSVSRGRSEE